MTIVICPGIHDPNLTNNFLEKFSFAGAGNPLKYLVFPTQTYPAFSAFYLRQFLQQHLSFDRNGKPEQPILLISFSAGVVAAIALAQSWSQAGGNIQALIALDGWGVPLSGPFPIYRLSHDHFTHWSSALLGRGQDSFYADPPVEHLELWRSPDTVQGWHCSNTKNKETRSPTTAAQFITALLKRHPIV